MNRGTKAKVITTIICLLLSLFALYAFAFVIDVSKGLKIALIIVAVGWIATGIWNLIEYLGKKK